MGRIRKIITTVCVALTVAAPTSAALVTPAAAAAPYCGITWGSLAKSRTGQSTAPIVNLRAGQHTCFDRLVIDLRSTPSPGLVVGYVSQFTGNATGEPIPLRGGAFLRIAVFAPAHDSAGRPTYPQNRPEAVDVSGFRTFRQVHFDNDFEALTNIGLGVRARLPFQVFTLPGPGTGTRLVIDVAHRW